MAIDRISKDLIRHLQDQMRERLDLSPQDVAFAFRWLDHASSGYHPPIAPTCAGAYRAIRQVYGDECDWIIAKIETCFGTEEEEFHKRRVARLFEARVKQQESYAEKSERREKRWRAEAVTHAKWLDEVETRKILDKKTAQKAQTNFDAAAATWHDHDIAVAVDFSPLIKSLPAATICQKNHNSYPCHAKPVEHDPDAIDTINYAFRDYGPLGRERGWLGREWKKFWAHTDDLSTAQIMDAQRLY